MCGRSSLTKKQTDLEKRFKAKFYSADIEKYNLLPKYNLCPTTFVPVKANFDSTHFQFFHWGMDITTWQGEVKKNAINARIENILKVGTFKDCLETRRCLLPATSYFEWKAIDKLRKLPYLIKLKSQDVFSLAGLWISQEDKYGDPIHKFVLITQPPTKRLSFIHDRMPGIITLDKEEDWLDPKVSGVDALKLINQHPDDDIVFHTVTNKLNKSFDNDPQFIVECRHEIEEQGSLF
jgi:putative SOS response-associated peptidase YedK